LREIDFSATSVHFTGQVEEIPHALLTPEEFAARAGEAILTDAYMYPATYGTSRITLLVPDGVSFVIAESSPLASDKIYLNGLVTESIGSPGISEETTVTGDAFFSYTVQPREGKIEMVQQVANYAHRKNEAHANYVIGEPAAMRAFVSRAYFGAAFMMGCFALFFLVHITLFLLFPVYKSNLYFALFSLVWLARASVTGPKLITAMFPDLPWLVAQKIEYITLPLAVVVFTYVYHLNFPRMVQKLTRVIILVTSAGYIACILWLPSLLVSQLLIYFQAVMVAAMLYFAVRIAMTVRNPNFLQLLFLGGGAFFLYGGLHDLLFYRNIFIPPFGIYGNAPISEETLLLFTCLQMIAAFIGTAQEVARSTQEKNELSAKNEILSSLNAMKSQFLADASHEMRTPLAVISTNVQLAAALTEAGGDDQAEVLEAMQIAQDEAMRFARMISSILTLSSMADKQQGMQALDFGALVKSSGEAYRLLVEAKGNTFSVTIGGNLKKVFGDADLLTQLINNLLQNANRHTENGRISLTLTHRDSREEGGVVLSLSDTGEGIAPEFLPSVFERGVSGSGGTGYGLYLCQTITELHHGEILIESAPGSGTTVTLVLPEYAGSLGGGEDA
jgi:signal transduction histidine kinase